MTDAILPLVPTYGLTLLFVVAALAAIGIPLPSTLTVMAVGAFVAAGDLELVPSFITALVAAVLGDQAGYQIGRRAGPSVEKRLSKRPSTAAQFARSKSMVHRWGGHTVFLTRWLLAPIGPTTNIICGAGDMRWVTFTVADLLGEIAWVSLYLWLGYTFHANIEYIASLIGQTSWLLIAGIAAVIMGRRLLKILQKLRRERIKI